MEIGWKERFRYNFDNLMAKGITAQVGLLGGLTAALIIVATVLVVAGGLAPEGEEGELPGFWAVGWTSLMRTLDAGNVAGDTGNFFYIALMFLVTLGGLFITSAFIGVLNNGLTDLLDKLRKGRSMVVEKDHTVILGFSPKVHTLLSELAEANSNKPNACVVVLADRDKVEMDDEIRDRQEKPLKVVTRSGSPLRPSDLAIANLASARSVIVLSPETDSTGTPMDPRDADTVVLKTLLALTKASGKSCHFHVVAEIQDERIQSAARIVFGTKATLILAPPLISRLLVQTGRQSGLSSVYTELLDFAGCEMYMQAEPRLVGRTFMQALHAYDDSAILGVQDAKGNILLPPPLDRVIQLGDQLIAISEDDDTVVANGKAGAIIVDAIVSEPPVVLKKAERTLVLGAGPRIAFVLKELDAYVAAGSETLVLGEDEMGATQGHVDTIRARLRHMSVRFEAGDVTDRALLDATNVNSYDQVLVLSETEGHTQEVADARTLLTLLHLRDIARKSGHRVPITSEILDVENRELATVSEADDFVVSNTLISLLIAQVSENPKLAVVFDDLFCPEGYETYLKPASHYVTLGREIDFYTVVEAAARRNQVAFGYRYGRFAKDPEKGYGVVVNPRKSDLVTFGENDSIVLLAND